MLISEFKGIQQYHDGRPVSDYCNMIPLGNSVIDRHGEEVIRSWTGETIKPIAIETFVDSLGNIYIASQAWVRVIKPDGSYNTLLSGSDGYSPSVDDERFVTFTESSTKPSQVYVCDGAHVWYWNTQAADITDDKVDHNYTNRYRAFAAFRIQFLIDTPDDWSQIPNPNATDGTVKEYIGWPKTYTGDEHIIDSIAWFDNRLVLVEKNRNTVWLSAVDPSRWFTPTYESDGKLYPMAIYQPRDSEKPPVGINSLFPNYYASTASSANIQEVIAFAGQLYFLNDTSIEVWSATGNDQNPIQHNSQNTLYYGGRSPVIVDDTLYILCKGAIHNDFVAAIKQNGQIAHISNDEIDKMLMPRAFRIRPLAVRDQSMMVVYTDKHYTNGYAFTKTGAWWRYWNDNNEGIAWSVVNKAGEQIGVTKFCTLARAVESNRNYVNGKPILRQIRGGWSQYTGRKILREVEIVCDTGIYLDTDMDKIPGNVFLRVSFDRGNNFGSYVYRKLGSSSKNDKVLLWRNCGSGNSLLMEFGTSDNIRFQIYGLRFELA